MNTKDTLKLKLEFTKTNRVSNIVLCLNPDSKLVIINNIFNEWWYNTRDMKICIINRTFYPAKYV